MSVILKAGYVAFNGHVFSEAEANGYNVYTEDIEKAEKNGEPVILNLLLNKRNQYFKLVIGQH